MQNALPAPVKNERALAPETTPAVSTPAASKSPKPQVRRHVQFGPPSDGPEPVVEKVKLGKPAKPKREKVKADPKHVAAARELRDRYLEHVNTTPLLPQGKYDVSRSLGAQLGAQPIRSLPAA